MKSKRLCKMNSAGVGVCFMALCMSSPGLDLLQGYPTSLTAGDTSADHARAWEFTAADLYQATRFSFQAGKDLGIETGPADLGIGHCSDGAVWAVVIPKETGRLTRQGATQEEAIASIWLRFHPREINRLFPPVTISAAGTGGGPKGQMRAIAGQKMSSSWQSGGRAMIPAPKDLTVDVDMKSGPRRFFVVDTEAGTAKYVAAFEGRAVRQPPPLTADTARAAFDQLWEAFDRDYAMFVLRPEVDWAGLRGQYRPQALDCHSAYDFAEVCAGMLRNLRDLHVWLTVAGADIPVFNRPRAANSNPAAHRAILGGLNGRGRVQWAVTPDHIGFLAINGWSGQGIPGQCDEALEGMRGTRGLIIDVRLNGGGSEDLAQEVAGRFLRKEFVYAYSQFRDGPGHTNLTEKQERRVGPRGPWRYNRAVVVLIGQKGMSSNESFVAMMSGDPEATIMGDHTCGSSGNPRIVRLPLEMTVSVPRWIDYLPDGSPLDEHGFRPQVPFQAAPGAFEGERDDLLTAALGRLRLAPLPDKPIAGP